MIRSKLPPSWMGRSRAQICVENTFYCACHYYCRAIQTEIRHWLASPRLTAAWLCSTHHKRSVGVSSQTTRTKLWVRRARFDDRSVRTKARLWPDPPKLKFNLTDLIRILGKEPSCVPEGLGHKWTYCCCCVVRPELHINQRSTIPLIYDPSVAIFSHSRNLILARPILQDGRELLIGDYCAFHSATVVIGMASMGMASLCGLIQNDHRLCAIVGGQMRFTDNASKMPQKCTLFMTTRILHMDIWLPIEELIYLLLDCCDRHKI